MRLVGASSARSAAFEPRSSVSHGSMSALRWVTLDLTKKHSAMHIYTGDISICLETLETLLSGGQLEVDVGVGKVVKFH